MKKFILMAALLLFAVSRTVAMEGEKYIFQGKTRTTSSLMRYRSGDILAKQTKTTIYANGRTDVVVTTVTKKASD